MLINMCRVCGKSNICDRSLNLFEGANRKLLRRIYILTGLRLRKLQEAPVFICLCCQSDLRIAIAFRKLCIKTQKKWQPRARAEVASASASSQSDSDAETPAQTVRRLPVRKTRKINAYKESDEDEEAKPQQMLQVLLKEEDTSMHDVHSTATDGERDHLDLSYDIKSEGNTSNDEEYAPAAGTTERRKNGDNDKVKPNLQVYICEQCGTHVKTKASFERHMRKHTGERPFGCQICPARFLSASELRAHGLTHTGERPYPCRYCERKYVSYMGRLKHERTHTNERPFVCATCGKAFTNSYILKNHMLVHTGERLFRCDLCERSFQRKTHLRTHYRSNTHKQNVEKHQNTQVLDAPGSTMAAATV